MHGYAILFSYLSDLLNQRSNFTSALSAVDVSHRQVDLH